MITEREKKVESSVPVQSRIDIRLLAEMVMYWESQGVYVKSMSQLLAWSLDLCKQVIESNGQLPKVIETVLEANEFLVLRELYQPGTGMGRKGKNKVVRARQLENLRLEGIDPKFGNQGGKNEYRLAHNSHSVEALDDIVIRPGVSLSDDEWQAVQDKIKEEDLKEARAALNRLKVDKDGLVVPEDGESGYVWKAMVRDSIPSTVGLDSKGAKEVLKKLNQPSTDDEGVVQAGDKVKGNQPSDSRPRKLSEEELDEKEVERERKDREQEAELKGMNEGVEHKFVQ